MKTPLAECAAYHNGQVLVLREFRKAAEKLNMGTQIIDADIAMHERFALACAEADGSEKESAA